MSTEKVYEVVPGYGDITVDFKWADCNQSDPLTHGSVGEAVGEELADLLWDEPPEEWPGVLEVELYVPYEVTEQRIEYFADNLLEMLQEQLDEDDEFGHPEEPVEFANPEACKEAMRGAVGFAMRDRPIYWCRVIKTIQVKVMEWVQAEKPGWVRPTGSKDPKDGAIVDSGLSLV